MRTKVEDIQNGKERVEQMTKPEIGAHGWPLVPSSFMAAQAVRLTLFDIIQANQHHD